MLTYIIAGRYDSPQLAECQIIGEQLEKNFNVHIIIIFKHLAEWDEFSSKLFRSYGFSYKANPIIYTLQGELIGDAYQFIEHISNKFGFRSHTNQEIIDQRTKYNIDLIQERYTRKKEGPSLPEIIISSLTKQVQVLPPSFYQDCESNGFKYILQYNQKRCSQSPKIPPLQPLIENKTLPLFKEEYEGYHKKLEQEKKAKEEREKKEKELAEKLEQERLIEEEKARLREEQKDQEQKDQEQKDANQSLNTEMANKTDNPSESPEKPKILDGTSAEHIQVPIPSEKQSAEPSPLVSAKLSEDIKPKVEIAHHQPGPLEVHIPESHFIASINKTHQLFFHPDPLLFHELLLLPTIEKKVCCYPFISYSHIPRISAEGSINLNNESNACILSSTEWETIANALEYMNGDIYLQTLPKGKSLNIPLIANVITIHPLPDPYLKNWKEELPIEVSIPYQIDVLNQIKIEKELEEKRLKQIEKEKERQRKKEEKLRKKQEEYELKLKLEKEKELANAMNGEQPAENAIPTDQKPNPTEGCTEDVKKEEHKEEKSSEKHSSSEKSEHSSDQSGDEKKKKKDKKDKKDKDENDGKSEKGDKKDKKDKKNKKDKKDKDGKEDKEGKSEKGDKKDKKEKKDKGDKKDKKDKKGKKDKNKDGKSDNIEAKDKSLYLGCPFHVEEIKHPIIGESLSYSYDQCIAALKCNKLEGITS